MARRIGLLMVLVAVAVGAWFVSTWALGLPSGFSLAEPSAAPPNAAAAAKPPLAKPPAEASGGAYRTEEEWIVSDIAAGLAGMAEFARSGTVNPPRSAPATSAPTWPSPATAPRSRSPPVRCATPSRSPRISGRPTTSSASPRRCSARSRRPRPAPQSRPDRPSSILANVTDLRVETLIDENRRLSAELKANMRSAIAHEESALLLGAFMQRESAGDFDDARSLLSRMTAHLAFARALRAGASQPSLAARVAEALMLNAINRQRDALQLLSTIETAADVPGAAAWARALRESITGDWRVARPAAPTLLERLVHARVRKKRLGETRAHEFIEAVADEKERITDWERILLSSPFTVDAGTSSRRTRSCANRTKCCACGLPTPRNVRTATSSSGASTTSPPTARSSCRTASPTCSCSTGADGRRSCSVIS